MEREKSEEEWMDEMLVAHREKSDQECRARQLFREIVLDDESVCNLLPVFKVALVKESIELKYAPFNLFREDTLPEGME